MSWLPWVVAVPLGGAIAAFLAPRRAAGLGLIGAAGTAFSVAVLVLGTATQGARRYALGGWGVPLGIDLRVDAPAALMLGATAVIGLLSSVYMASHLAPDRKAPASSRDEARSEKHFWPLWLFLWAALNALFVSADAFNLYVTLELVGLSAVALAALPGTRPALTAAARYLLVSLAGSLFYLLGVALLYGRYGVLDLGLLAGTVTSRPATAAAMALITGGLVLKTALFPLHFWLPPAHANAPAPVSALLSGVVVEASFYVLLRYWFEVFAPLGMWGAGDLLGALGACAILWGSLQALAQPRLKLLVAYSTVAQVGYLFLVFPLARGPGGLAAWSGAVYFVLAHACAKGAMFLASGTVMRLAGHDRIDDLAGIGHRVPVSMFAFGLAGMSLMGLPPSGGFVAKWSLLKAAVADGRWWWLAIILAGSLLAAGYVFRIIARLFAKGAPAVPGDAPPRLLEWSACALALLAVALGLFAAYPLDWLEQSAPIAGLRALGG